MKTRSQVYSRKILRILLLALATTLAASPVAAQEGYLAVGGQNSTVELLRLTDFSKIAAIDVSPLGYPLLRFLPLSRRLYVYDPDLTGLNAVLDFSTCSGGLLRPLSIPYPLFVGPNGNETRLFISSHAGDVEGNDNNATYILDVSSDTVVGSLQQGTGEVIFDPDRNELYVWTYNVANVYDPNFVLVRQCIVPDSGRNVIAAGKIYSSSSSSSDLFDALTCSPFGQLHLPGKAEAAVRTRAGDKVYLLTTMFTGDQGNPAFLSRNAVAVIDTATDQVSSFPLGREIYLGSLALSADESHAYVSMWLFDAAGEFGLGGGELGVVDLQTGVVEHHPLDVNPTDVDGLALIDKLGFQCGDGILDAACGEQCDDGNQVDGDGCDSNCTTGCGNGIVGPGEQCDDGNTNNNDGCKNDCTVNVCGDGVVNRGLEQCDDGALNGIAGDACSASCVLPPRTVSGQLAAGEMLSTDAEGDGATAAAPVETWVTSPLAGSVSIEEGAPDPTSPSGYAFLGYSVHVTVPASTAENPIVLVFEIHSSLLPLGSDQSAVEMSKNGALVLDCDEGTSSASPDPCVAGRELLVNGNLRISIRSSTASYWGGLAPFHDARVLPRRQMSLTIPVNKLAVTKKALLRVRNMDRMTAGKKRTTPIQLTATNVDCPLGLIADVPDFKVRTPFSQDTITLAPKRTATARLRLVASRFAFPKDGSPRHCTIRLSATAQVADNVDPTPLDNTTTVQITVTTR